MILALHARQPGICLLGIYLVCIMMCCVKPNQPKQQTSQMYQFCSDRVYTNRLIGEKEFLNLQQGRRIRFPNAVRELMFTQLINELQRFHGQLFIGWHWWVSLLQKASSCSVHSLDSIKLQQEHNGIACVQCCALEEILTLVQVLPAV